MGPAIAVHTLVFLHTGLLFLRCYEAKSTLSHSITKRTTTQQEMQQASIVPSVRMRTRTNKSSLALPGIFFFLHRG